MNYNIIKMDYYDDFHCICDECKNNCCNAKWEITMSKSDYNKIKSSKKTKFLDEKCTSIIKRIKDGNENDDYRYAKIEPIDGKCAFLQNGWCSLQKECGEGALPEICRIFPRHATCIANIAVKSCTLACEAVITELMKRQHGISLTFSQSNNEPDLIREVYSFNIDNTLINSKPIYSMYMEFLNLAFSVLQNREISFGGRLILLGMAFAEIQQFCDNNAITQIPSIVDKYIKSDVKNLKDTLQSIKSDKNKCINMYIGVYEECLRNNKFFLNFSVFESFAQNHTLSNHNERLSANYDKVIPYLAQNEIYLENMILNEFISQRYPFKVAQATLWENYIALCALYSTYIITLAEAADNGINDDVFYDSTSGFFRIFTHSDYAMRRLLDMYKVNNLDTLPTIATMVQFF